METIQINKTKPSQEEINTMITLFNAAVNSPQTSSAIFLSTCLENDKMIHLSTVMGSTDILLPDIVFGLLKLKNKDLIEIIRASLALYDLIEDNPSLVSMIEASPSVMRRVIQNIRKNEQKQTVTD